MSPFRSGAAFATAVVEEEQEEEGFDLEPEKPLENGEAAMRKRYPRTIKDAIIRWLDEQL